jgi:hypothetical protein
MRIEVRITPSAAISNGKSASVHECVRSNRYDLLGTSVDENWAFLELKGVMNDSAISHQGTRFL